MFTKLVDEKKEFLISSQNIFDFFLMKKAIHIMNKRKQNKYPSFYSMFNMSSCRKPEIQKA